MLRWRIRTLPTPILFLALLFCLLAAHYAHYNSHPANFVIRVSPDIAGAARQRFFARSPAAIAPPSNTHSPLAILQPDAWRAHLTALRVLGVPTRWDAASPLHARLLPQLVSRAEDATLIVMYGNSGMLPLMMNAICHWHRLGMRNYVVFSHGAATLGALRGHPLLHGPPDVAVLDLLSLVGDINDEGANPIDVEAYQNFGGAAFRRVTAFKYLAVELIVQLGLHVILQDTDVVPQRDYRPIMLRLACEAMERASAGSAPQPGPQRCGTSDHTLSPPSDLFAADTAPFLFVQPELPYKGYNTGFYLMRSCWFSLFALRHMAVLLARGVGVSDQHVLEDWVAGWGDVAEARIERLEWKDFPSGWGWTDPANQYVDAVLVHANWMVGVEGKLNKLYNAGLLLWEDGRCVLK